MKLKSVNYLAVLAILFAGVVLAGDGPRRDQQAIEVLTGMSEYLAGLERFAVSGYGSSDARLDAGLIVANPMEVKLRVERPGSLRLTRFDGEQTQEIYLHAGVLTLYRSGEGYYARAEAPGTIEAAMEFTLLELGIDAPLMDLLYKDVFAHLAGTSNPVLYLTDKSRVDGKDCHHVAIRNQEVDVQLWVEEGERPVPRQLIITSKWEGGAPRFMAQLKWDTGPQFADDVFEFTAPDGATQIEFAPASVE